MDDLVARFFTAFRTLEMTRARELLDELEMMELPDKVIDKMASVVLPIYYPADPGSSKLRFVIQCSAAAFLVKHSPKLRASVLDSLIEIYERFPHVIGSSKPLKIVVEALTACDDFWVVFQSQTEGRSVDFRWCLLLYCFDSGVSTVEGWKAVESLMQNKETFDAGRFEKILEFLTRAVDAWGPNAMISQLLIDPSLSLHLKNDVPRFLYDRGSSPVGIPEKVIDVMSANLTQVNGPTARTLAMIARNDGKFESKMMQLSLYLALIERTPENYLGPLGQRLWKLVHENAVDPACAAHIAAITSSFPLKGYSFFDKFCKDFMGNSNDQSRFFEYLADCAEFLNQQSLVPVLTDALNSVSNGIVTYGICKLILSLLETLARHRELLPEPAVMGDYSIRLMNVLNDISNTKSSVSAAVDNSTPLAKIIAKLAVLSGINPCAAIPFNVTSIAHATNICAVTAFCLRYGTVPLQGVDHVAACMLISSVYGLEESFRSLSEYAPGVFNVCQFPPPGFLFDAEMARIISDAIVKVSFRLELIDRRKCIEIASEFLNYVTDGPTTRSLISSLWIPSYLVFIPVHTIPVIVQKLMAMDRIELVHRMFLAYMNHKPTPEFSSALSNCFDEPGFREWFIARVLALAAARSETALHLAREIDHPRLTPEEFSLLIPALLKVLPYSQGPQRARAAAMKLVAAYPKMNAELTEYVRALATSILGESEKPDFPHELESTYGTCDMTALSSAGIVSDNGFASSSEIGASLSVLGKYLLEEETRTGEILSKVHRQLCHSTDPRVRRSYLEFLGSIGTPGLPYAQQIAPMPSVPLF